MEPTATAPCNEEETSQREVARSFGSFGTPHIVGIGGTVRVNSSTEKALRISLEAARARGATVTLLAGSDLELPMYVPDVTARTPQASRLVRELRNADGLIIASPGYHGGISGLIKNALDYVEDLNSDSTPYLEGRAVGCIVTAAGWQASVTTLMALRTFVHAARGWPTPLGITINTTEPAFDAEGACLAERLDQQLDLLAHQVVQFTTCAYAAKAKANRVRDHMT